MEINKFCQDVKRIDPVCNVYNEARRQLREEWIKDSCIEEKKRYFDIFEFKQSDKLMEHAKFLYELVSEKSNEAEFWRLIVGKSVKWG